MKKFYFVLFGVFLFVVCGSFTFQISAQNELPENATSLISPNIVVSQFQVAGATANDEFIELHNTSASPVDLSGLRVVYRSTSGTNDVLFAEWTTSTIIPAGGYYLIASTGYDGATVPNFIYNPTTCACSMSATSGGIAVRSGASNSGVIIDSVGFGAATNVFVETTTTIAPPANTGQARLNNGCQDSDNNSNDFSNVNPAAPRNAASAPVTCGNTGGNTILIGGGANPNTVAPNGTTLLTVSVVPAANPPSTGITVVGNLTSIGGAAAQQFLDNGTNGDQTAGDNVYSFLATIPADLSGGTRSVTVTASDAQTRSTSLTFNITINAPLADDNPLLLGNPSDATTDIANENNYLMIKPQFSLSYNRSRATANWVAWRLDSSWIGTSGRQDDFRPDETLPAGWYRVLDTDYSNSGYDRGHMTPSGDRTRSVSDNSATFLMTNIVPQLAANNQGAWNDFENYLRSLAQGGQEIYIFSGVAGNIGTIAQGKIVVPAVTWKVVLILPNGTDDLQRIGKGTRAFGIIVPNQPPLSTTTPWRNFRVTVNEVEYLTGYDFFSEIPKNSQELIKRRRDRQ
jgi:endonuclease G